MSKIQVNEIVNHFDNGAPDCPKGFTVSSGISTFTGAIDANGSLDVDGHTNLDNVNISGVVTATSFVGNVTGNVTGNADSATTATNAQGLTGSPSISVASLVATGNVTIGGTLTYDDVTNIDSVGIITAKAGINVTGGQLNVGSNIKLGNAGVITATSFSGTVPSSSLSGALPAIDGSALTGIAGTANVSTNTLNVTGVSSFNEDIKLRDGKDIFFFDSLEQSTGRIFAGSPAGIYMSATRGILNFSNQSTTGTNAGQIKLNCHSSNSIEQQVGGTTKLQVNGSGIDVTGVSTFSGAINSNSNVGVQTTYPTSSTLVGAASSLIGLYIGDGHLLFSDNLSRPGGYFIPNGLNALNAGPVTLGSTMTLDGVWVIV